MAKIDPHRFIMSENVKEDLNTRARIFCFNYKDLADLYGVSIDTVRHWICNDLLDPADLNSIFKVRTMRSLKNPKYLDCVEEFVNKILTKF